MRPSQRRTGSSYSSITAAANTIITGKVAIIARLSSPDCGWPKNAKFQAQYTKG